MLLSIKLNKIMTYFVALLCVFGLVAGQVLFKMSATGITETGSYLSSKFLLTFSCAIILYSLSTIAWIWVLQKIELGKIYPLMSLAFILVPFASYFLLNERFNNQYYIGVLFIMVGIIIILKK